MNADFVFPTVRWGPCFTECQEGFNIITAPSIRVVDKKAGICYGINYILAGASRPLPREK